MSFKYGITRVDQRRLHYDNGVFDDLFLSWYLFSRDRTDARISKREALVLDRVLEEWLLKQRETAELLHIPQPKVSAPKNYPLDQFSVERLMRFLTALGRDVEIRITAAARRRARGRIHVEAA